jgi:hypothetical protein
VRTPILPRGEAPSKFATRRAAWGFSSDSSVGLAKHSSLSEARPSARAPGQADLCFDRHDQPDRHFQSAFAEGGELAGGVAVSGTGFGVEKYRKKSDFGLMSARVRPLAKLFS